jgi:hypothetical protein
MDGTGSTGYFFENRKERDALSGFRPCPCSDRLNTIHGQVRIDKKGAAAISLEPMPAGAAISLGQRLDLSSIAPQSLAPLKADAVPLMSLSPPPVGLANRKQAARPK